ncbi:MAG: hypothetical protein HY690_01715 [Chloroflexi bacterium]|nr:hypothetical protein [Chloroflexota bacterium]
MRILDFGFWIEAASPARRTVTTRFKGASIQNPKSKIQNPKSKIQNPLAPDARPGYTAPRR